MNSASYVREKHAAAILIVLSLVTSLQLSAMLIQDTSAQTTHEVLITGFTFVPQNITVDPGDTIRWNNTDPVIHTLWFVHTPNGSTYLLSDPIAPGATWNHTFNSQLQLQYYSLDRLWMTGFIETSPGDHDIAVTNVFPEKTVICRSCSGNITVVVENQGAYSETFNTTAFADTQIIGKTAVTLGSGLATSLRFRWNTTSFAKGNYTMKGVADNVSGETDTGDNSYVDDWIIVSMLGDLTGPDGWPDGKCDIRDVALVASRFGSNYPDPRYDINLDITGPLFGVADGKIDIRDIALVASRFGNIDP